MNSSTLKHQVKLQEWVTTVQEYKSSGLPVKHWCKKKGITSATYYRWKRKLLSIFGNIPRRRACRHICRTTCSGTTVSQRFRRFRNTSYWRWQYYDSPGANAGAAACHYCCTSVMLSDSAADEGTGSRRCTGKATDLCCYTNVCSQDSFSGPAQKQKLRP